MPNLCNAFIWNESKLSISPRKPTKALNATLTSQFPVFIFVLSSAPLVPMQSFSLSRLSHPYLSGLDLHCLLLLTLLLFTFSSFLLLLVLLPLYLLPSISPLARFSLPLQLFYSTFSSSSSASFLLILFLLLLPSSFYFSSSPVRLFRVFQFLLYSSPPVSLPFTFLVHLLRLFSS